MFHVVTTRAVRRFAVIAALLSAGALGACAANQAATAATAVPASSALLTVTNRATFDMDVYLVRGGQRIRLGLAPAGQSTEFELKPPQYTGFGQLQFLALPIVSGHAVSTELLDVRKGDRITLDIPPQ